MTKLTRRVMRQKITLLLEEVGRLEKFAIDHPELGGQIGNELNAVCVHLNNSGAILDYQDHVELRPLRKQA